MPKMKPFPKFLIIVVGVAAVVTVIKIGLNMMPEKPVSAPPAAPVAVPAESATSAPQVVAQPAVASAPTLAAPADPAPLLQPAPTNDAGLANVLNGKK